MDRRAFLKGGLSAGAALALGPSLWQSALARPASRSAFGPLTYRDPATGLLLPEGFTSRVIARANQPVGTSGYVWHIWPDGGATFPMDDGGWVYTSNSEVPLGGGAGAVRFAADGTIQDAYRILTGTSLNCAGGATPWGTWLSGEEWDGGYVWECEVEGPGQGVAREAMGSFKHEAAAVDPDDPTGQRVYLTEDQPDGCLYRFTPTTAGDLSAGRLDVLVATGPGPVTWAEVPNPNPVSFPEQDRYNGTVETPTRHQVPGAMPFDGGEGCHYHDGLVYFTTKGDNRVWTLDVAAQSLAVLYDDDLMSDPPLRGVDNVVVSAAGNVFVAEDGGNMEICVITRDHVVAPVVRMDGPEHQGSALPPGVPENDVTTLPFKSSEVAGPAFDPSGSRLYASSQRGDRFGITYEITFPPEHRQTAKRGRAVGHNRPRRAQH